MEAEVEEYRCEACGEPISEGDVRFDCEGVPLCEGDYEDLLAAEC